MSMTALIFVWFAVLVSVVVVRGGRDKSLLAATLFVAISVTTNLDALYLFTDRSLGNRNLVTLVGDLCLVFGTYFLARGITRATLPKSRHAEKWAFSAALVVSVISTALFFQIRMQGSTNAFMASYGSQAAAAAYSLIQISYLGVCLFAAGRVVLHNYPDRQSPNGLRICAALVIAGCSMSVVLMISVYAMDLAHLVGNKAVQSIGQHVYGLANPLTVMLVAGGLAAWRVCGWLPDVLWNRQAARMVRKLEPVHLRIGEAQNVPTGRSVAAKLHRIIVEIQDAALTSQSPDDLLTSEETANLIRATRLLGVSD